MGHDLAKVVRKAVVYLLCRTDTEEGETLDSVFQSGAFQKLIQPAESDGMFYKVITTNLASIVHLYAGDNRQRFGTEDKQLMSLFTDKIDQQALAKAFPPAPAKVAKEKVSLRKHLVGKWTGDPDGYAKANPDSKDEVARTLHRILEYEFTAEELTMGGKFILPSDTLRAKYSVLREDKDHAVLQTAPTGMKGSAEVQILWRQAEVTVTDQDHMHIVWMNEKGEKEAGKEGGLYLKRAPAK